MHGPRVRGDAGVKNPALPLTKVRLLRFRVARDPWRGDGAVAGLRRCCTVVASGRASSVYKVFCTAAAVFPPPQARAACAHRVS